MACLFLAAAVITAGIPVQAVVCQNGRDVAVVLFIERGVQLLRRHRTALRQNRAAVRA